MAMRNVKMPLSTDNKAKVLCKLQGSIHFEKTLTASGASGYLGRNSRLALPFWFVQMYGDRFRKSVILRTESSTNTGSPKGFPSQAQRKWTHDSGISQKKAAKQSYECRDENLAAESGMEAGTVKSNHGEHIAKKKTVAEECAISASGHSPKSLRYLSYSKDSKSKNVIDSSSRGHHDSNNGQEPALDHDELMVSGATRNFQLPGFFKKLAVSNFCHREKGEKTAQLEIPLYFWRIYGSRLHSLVKLQGIREESQVRTVACLPSCGKQTRLYMRAGWRDFANENNLEIGQELFFTLTADSFFVVREVLPPSREMSRDRVQHTINPSLGQHE